MSNDTRHAASAPPASSAASHSGASLHVAPTTPDLLAEMAVADVVPGMVVGLGTGKTSARAAMALARRIRDEALDVRCVCTSQTTEALAADLALPLASFPQIERLDLMFDGADEVDGRLRMLKGSAGALVRQRIVAHAADRRLYLVSERKLVPRLGVSAALAVVVVPFGLAFVRSRLRNMGLSGVLRRRMDGDVFFTDGGSLILDVSLGERSPEEVAELLDHVPGVVDHGLFPKEADEVLVEDERGHVRRLSRERVG